MKPQPAIETDLRSLLAAATALFDALLHPPDNGSFDVSSSGKDIDGTQVGGKISEIESDRGDGKHAAGGIAPLVLREGKLCQRVRTGLERRSAEQKYEEVGPRERLSDSHVVLL